MSTELEEVACPSCNGTGIEGIDRGECRMPRCGFCGGGGSVKIPAASDDADTQTRTLQVISEHAGDMPVSLIKGEMNLSQHLGMDPADTADMVMALEAEFGISIGPRVFPHPLSTVAEIVAMVEGIRKQALEVK